MQKNFPEPESATKKTLTRRDRFFAAIGKVMPRGKLQQVIKPFYGEHPAVPPMNAMIVSPYPDFHFGDHDEGKRTQGVMERAGPAMA
jgi:hypothetical protein